MEKITICIAARNEERCLPDTVRSVWDQTHPAISEILICVNGSTDSTFEVARSLSRQDRRVRVLTTNPGKSNAWNALVRAARTELLAFVDADVRLVPHAVQTLVRELTGPTVAASAFMGRCRRPSRPGEEPRVVVVGHAFIQGRFYVMRSGPVLAAMRRRTGRDTIPAHIINEDEWICRVLTDPETGHRGYTVVPAPLVLFRVGGSILDRLRSLIRVRMGSRQAGAYLDPPCNERRAGRHKGSRAHRRQMWRDGRRLGKAPLPVRLRFHLKYLVLKAVDLWLWITVRDPRLPRRSPTDAWPVNRTAKKRLPAGADQAVRPQA